MIPSSTISNLIRFNLVNPFMAGIIMNQFKNRQASSFIKELKSMGFFFEEDIDLEERLLVCSNWRQQFSRMISRGATWRAHAKIHHEAESSIRSLLNHFGFDPHLQCNILNALGFNVEKQINVLK